MRRVRAAALGAAIAAGGLLPAACTTTRPVMLPDKPHAYVVACSGANLSWSHCYRKAGHICPHGYVVVQKPYKRDERVAAGDVLQLLGNSGNHRRMLIACRSGDQPATGATAAAGEPETGGATQPQR